MVSKAIALKAVVILAAAVSLSAEAGPYPGQGVTPDVVSAWATVVVDSLDHTPPDQILGAVDGMLAVGISGGGWIVVGFDEPLRNGPGADFAVWENGFTVVGNRCYLELGFVDVSTDQINWVSFPTVFLDSPDSNPKLDPNNLYNLAGNYVANYVPIEERQGTPFNLDDILDSSEVISGLVDPNNINYVRLRDIVGANDGGSTYDQATFFGYPEDHLIYDGLSYGGGADWDAVGVIDNLPPGDFNKSGQVDSVDLYIMKRAWLSQPGDDNWDSRCDISDPNDSIINNIDYAKFAGGWHSP